jgi:uncharacterized YkwD family protein
MRNRFVKITLILTMLLVVAIPTQAFAAEKKCNLNQSNAQNTNISKIYSLSPASASKIAEQLSHFKSGSIDAAQLQKLIQQFAGSKATTAKAVPAAPAKPAATTPAKPTPATPAAPANPAPATPAAPSAPAALGNYEQQVVDLVNKERAAAGLPALKANTKLAAVAEKKAEDLRDKNYFDHQSPTYGSPFDMMKQFGITYTSAGENIAKGQKTPAEVMNGWMNSPGHRANILNSSYTEIGVGYVTDSNGTAYWVQHFIRP